VIVATARPALETVDERLRPRQSNFGSLGAGMIERGKVPAHILYGAESAESEAPADGIIDVNVAAAAAASLLQLRALASVAPRPTPREVEPARPSPPVEAARQPDHAPVAPVEPVEVAPAEVVAKVVAEVVPIDERVRPRQSNFGSLGASMVERGNVPAHILYGGPLSAAQIELLLNPDVVVTPAAAPGDPASQPGEADALAAPPVDQPDAPAVSPEAVVAPESGVVTEPPVAEEVAAEAAGSAAPLAVEPALPSDREAPETRPDAAIELAPSEPLEPLVLDVAKDGAAVEAAPHGEQPSDDRDDTVLPTVVLPQAAPTAEAQAGSMLRLAAPEHPPAPEMRATPVAVQPKAELVPVVVTELPPAAVTALVPFSAPEPRKPPTSRYVAIGLAEAAVLALVCAWIAWRAPDPSETAVSEPSVTASAPLAESGTPAAMPAVEQAEPTVTAAATPEPQAAVASTTSAAAPPPAPAPEPVLAPPPATPVMVEQAPAPAAVPPPPAAIAPVVVEIALAPADVPPLPRFPAAPVAVERVSAPAPATPPATPPATGAAAPEQSADLLRRGDEYLRNGDVVTARLFYERAAELGDFQAMMALGQTYDPILLQQLGARGIVPDMKLAQRWYARAAEVQARGPSAGSR